VVIIIYHIITTDYYNLELLNEYLSPLIAKPISTGYGGCQSVS